MLAFRFPILYFHGKTYQCFKCSARIVDEIIVEQHLSRLKQQQDGTSTKLEVSKLFRPLDLLSLLASNDCATNHHGSHTDDHDPTMLNAVNRYDNSDVFAIDVQRRSDSHGIDGIVLAFDSLGLTHDAINGDMEAMIILRRKSEDTQCTTFVSGSVFGIGISEQSLHVELTTLDPDLGRLGKAVEHDASAVGRRDDNSRVLRCRAGSCIWLQGTVEEFVEVLEVVEGQ